MAEEGIPHRECDRKDEIATLRTEIELVKQDLTANHARRLDFLERIAFGFIGLIVLGVLTTLGGVIIWALGYHKGP
jgi:uncharacterized membrane protein